MFHFVVNGVFVFITEILKLKTTYLKFSKLSSQYMLSNIFKFSNKIWDFIFKKYKLFSQSVI